MMDPLPEPTLDDVRRALALPDFDYEHAWGRMAPRPRAMRRPPDLPGAVRPAGVLLLLYPRHGQLAFVLTRRSEDVASHKGQISLPGGSLEPGDRDPAETALRETCEEIDVCRADIEIVGALTPLYVIVSDFEIHPFVGYLPERPAFRPATLEVAQIIEMSLGDLIDPTVKVQERWNIRGYDLDVPFYRIDGQAVWGATAIILSEFEGRLASVLAV